MDINNIFHILHLTELSFKAYDDFDESLCAPLVSDSGFQFGSGNGGVLPLGKGTNNNSSNLGSTLDVKAFDFGPACGSACSEKKTCIECARGMCMWCKNLRMCTDRNAYLASFPYGQCMDWTTQINHCPDLTKKPNGIKDKVIRPAVLRVCHTVF